MTAHTHAGTHTYTHTRAHSLPAGLYSCVIPRSPLSASLFAIPCSKGCLQDPFPYKQGFKENQDGQDWVHGPSNSCVECTAHALQPRVQHILESSQLLAGHSLRWHALILASVFAHTDEHAGWLEEVEFHVRTQSVLPAHHGPCSKGGKTLQNPRRAPHAHLHPAGESGWVGSGKDPRLNSSCCSACEC